MQRPNAKVPQQQPTILADAAKPIVALIAPPRIERDARDPRVVALAARDEHAVFETPDADQVVLAACDDEPAVGGPADAEQAAVVGHVYG